MVDDFERTYGDLGNSREQLINLYNTLYDLQSKRDRSLIGWYMRTAAGIADRIYMLFPKSMQKKIELRELKKAG